MSKDIEDLDNWHGKPIPKDRVDAILKDLEAEIQVPNKSLCPGLPKEDTTPADLSLISLPSPPAYKKGDKVHFENVSRMVQNTFIYPRGNSVYNSAPFNQRKMNKHKIQ